MREISSLRMPLKPAARCQTCLRVLDNPVEAPPRAPAPAPPKRVLGARLSLLKPAAASAWIIRSCMINLEGVRIRGRVHNPPYLLTQVPRDERRDNRRNVSSEHMLAGASEETKVKKEKSRWGHSKDRSNPENVHVAGVFMSPSAVCEAYRGNHIVLLSFESLKPCELPASCCSLTGDKKWLCVHFMSSGTLGTGHPHYVHSGLLAHMAQGTQVLHVC
ncbi:uncharacterized protein LOC127977678 isoform X2 [Carassius gibelio]|uniref:uncharacterized protein LOC127977678 isoform X2 n=1 Tax=Carassius gibelio TaxID=101364 RepID=UPI0022795EB1|nr:uncharacterized protein LOC127977678 isoform X2 [Carassius gibelio]